MSDPRTEGIPLDMWEQAFIGGALPVDEEGFAAIVDRAADGAGVDISDRRDAEGGRQIVDEILDALEVGTIGVSFPQSMHGDAVSIRVSRFPGGTAVGWVSPSWRGRNVVFVVPRATYEDVSDAAMIAISDAQDGADWSICEDDEQDLEGGILARFFGFEELRQAWVRFGGTSVTKRRAK